MSALGWLLVFSWLLIVALVAAIGGWRRCTAELISLLERTLAERAALQRWLNVLGWDVSYHEHGTSIERRAEDPEEERLKR